MTRVDCCDNAGDKNDATAAHLLLHLNRNNGSNSARDFADGMDGDVTRVGRVGVDLTRSARTKYALTPRRQLGETYTLHRTGDEWKIVVAVVHDADGVLTGSCR